MNEAMFEATANDFPFVSELPKRERKKVANLWDRLGEMRKIMDEKGMLVPAPMAAKLLGVSRQRVHTLTGEGRMEIVEVDGHTFITEKSLVEFAQTERKNGRPFKTQSVKDIWKISRELAAGK